MFKDFKITGLEWPYIHYKYIKTTGKCGGGLKSIEKGRKHIWNLLWGFYLIILLVLVCLWIYVFSIPSLRELFTCLLAIWCVPLPLFLLGFLVHMIYECFIESNV